MHALWHIIVAKRSRTCGVDEMAEKIVIRLVKSLIGRKPEQRATVRSLGLRKISSCTVQEATPSILGMVHAVKHLVEVRPYAPGQEQKK